MNEVAEFQRIFYKIIEKEGLKETFACIDDMTICSIRKTTWH